MLALYREVFALAENEVLRELGISKDGLFDKVVDWFALVFGERFGEIKQRIARVTNIVNNNANASLAELPRIAQPKYLYQGIHTIADFRDRNVKLIRSVPEMVAKKAQKVLTENPNLHGKDLADAIQESTGATKAKAELWARDQTLKLHAQIVQDKHKSLGITEYIWRTSGDERVRGRVKRNGQHADHWILRDRKFSYANPPIVDPSKGRRCNPGEDYQCRCTAAPVIEGLDL